MKVMFHRIVLSVCLFLNIVSNAQRWQYVGEPRFPGGYGAAHISIDKNGTPYVLYIDEASGNRLSVKKYNGNKWIPVGDTGFASGWHYSMAFDSNSIPYVTSIYPTRIMKYNGIKWVNVGSPGFVAYDGEVMPIAIDKWGTPYVAYHDNNDSLISVAKFDGSNWVTVGNLGFSNVESWYPSLAIDSNGHPFVVFSNNVGYNTYVMKYNGHSWVNVGNPRFANSHGAVIVISNDGTPYVAFSDWYHDFKASVMKFNGTNWVYVGAPGFYSVSGDYVSIAIDKKGAPYVAFHDGVGAMVMRYNVSDWVTVGNPAFTGGDIGGISLAIDTAGVPYVAFPDELVVYRHATYCTKVSVMKLDSTLPAINLSPITGSNKISIGDTLRLSNPVKGGNWYSNDTTIATINKDGLVKGQTTGEATIFYTLEGCKTVKLSIEVIQNSVPNTSTSAVAVFPNPCNKLFTLKIPSSITESIKVVVTNWIGKKITELVTTTNMDTEIQMDYPSGIYFISALTAEGKQITKVAVQ